LKDILNSQDIQLAQYKTYGRTIKHPTRLLTNQKMFLTQTEEDYTIDACVMIVLDSSGSMGQIIGRMGIISAALYDAFKKIGVFVNAVAFNDHSSDSLSSDQLASIGAMGGTNIGGAMNTGYYWLMKQPESKKIMFVLTDGHDGRSTAGMMSDRCHDKGILVIGAGINGLALKQVKKIIPKCEAFECSEENLIPTFLSVVKKIAKDKIVAAPQYV